MYRETRRKRHHRRTGPNKTRAQEPNSNSEKWSDILWRIPHKKNIVVYYGINTVVFTVVRIVVFTVNYIINTVVK